MNSRPLLFLVQQLAGRLVPPYGADIHTVFLAVAVGAILLPVVGFIKYSLSSGQKRHVLAHMLDFASGMAHHTGRIDFRLGVHNFRRRDIILIAAMPLRFAVTPFTPDAHPFMLKGELFIAECVVTRTAKQISDEGLFFGPLLSGLFFDLLFD